MSGEESNPHFTTYRRWLGYALGGGGGALMYSDKTTVGVVILGLGLLLVVFHRKK